LNGVVMAIDPGREKCGVAITDIDGKILLKKILPTDSLKVEIMELINQFSPAFLILGKGTFSGEVRKKLEGISGNFTFRMVDEKHSTEKARKKYFKDHPPRGIWKFIPLGLQVPPEPYDDYAAQVLAEEFIRGGEGDA